MTIKVSQVLGAPEGSPAEFPDMPTVGGDPIVESGSNSDGVWTRWADGTQICANAAIATVPVLSTSAQTRSMPLPLPFSSSAYSITVVLGAPSADRYNETVYLFTAEGGDTANTASHYTIFYQLTATNSFVGRYSFHAVGRWK